MGNRRNPLNLGQAQEAEDLNPRPAQVEFPLLHRQFCRVRVGVMVVMQFFAANQDAPRHQVGRRIAAFEVAVADGMAQAIDHAGGPHRDPHHLDGPDGDADGAEQQQVDNAHDRDAQQREAAVEVALDPVFGAVLAVDAQRLGVFRFGAVQLGAFAQHRGQPLDDRAVRVIDGFAFGVMLAVDGRPLAGVLRRGQPQPETEEMLQAAIQLQGAMGRVTMQIDRDGDDRDVGHQQGDCYQRPGRQAKKTFVPHRL
ncbi:hypothetical protein D9M71_432510 [compost metagenome]